MKSKKILIILIIIISILAITGTVFGYLYMKTDTFKTDKELFSKYIYQNVEYFKKMEESQIIKKYDELKSEEKYESDIKVKTIYSEGGEVSNAINNLSAVALIQKDNTDNYFYADGQLILGEQKYLESEIIKDQEMYGVRFTDVVKQFITITDDENLDSVANDIGIDSVTLEKIMNIIDGTGKISETIISDSEIQSLIEKYSKLITDTISNGEFSSNKKAVITYNSNTTNSKAYTVKLTSEKVENLLIQILNNLKEEQIILNNVDESKEDYQNKIDKIITQITDETEIPEIKITVYEQNGNTIRTILEIGNNKLVLENTQSNEELKTEMQISIINSDNIDEYEVELTKNNVEGEEEINCIINVNQENVQYTISFLNDMKYTETDVQLKSSINYKKDILTISMDLEENITIGKEFEKKQVLESSNNFILNTADENVRKSVIEQLKQRVPEKLITRINLIVQELGLVNNEEETIIPEEQMTQVDINKFNAKFEFYTGDIVSSENVKTLLEIVKDNFGNCEITTIDDPENSEQTDPDEVRYNFKLIIERNKKDEESINQIIEKIEEDKKYKVSIFYKEQNKLIDYITIEDLTE